MPQFLCIVMDRATCKTLKEYPKVEAIDWYYARRIAADQYAKETGDKSDWYVDSLALDIEGTNP